MTGPEGKGKGILKAKMGGMRKTGTLEQRGMNPVR